MTVAFVYKWTHIPTLKWYVGSRTAEGCHPDDGYIASAKLLRKHILENKEEWKREVISIDSVKNVLDLETEILQMFDARHDPRSWNRHNNDGIIVITGDKNPMKDPEVAQLVANAIRGDNHWTHNLDGKEHPQRGQKRPTITGDNHPNKDPINAAKISKSHTGKRHEYMDGKKNIMHREEVLAQLSGGNHWVNKIENRLTCEHCGITIMKSNYTRWHSKNCKFKKE